MHYKTKEAAVTKYGPLIKTANREEITTAVASDEKKFTDSEVDEIVDAILNSKPKENGLLKWYDEFHVRIQKREVRNVLLQKNDTIITGWELVKKLQPKPMEPTVAKELNAFANGYDPNQVGLYLVEKDTMKTGDTIPYREWAAMMGIDPSQDINILLNPTK